jgi:hypothetical protein
MLYNQMKGQVVGEMHEFFFLCACLGFRKREHRSLEKPDDRFWSGTITPEEWCSFYAMILRDRDMDFSAVTDDKSVLERIEGYANGGAGILLEQVLAEYLMDKDGQVYVESGCMKEVPKLILNYVFDESLSE